jgi:hypothetical protein
MPSADDILKALTWLASEYMVVAILWHVAIMIVFLFALFFKQRLSNHLTGYFLSLPIFSVSFFAWKIHNPFNGSVFLVAGILLLFLTHKKKIDKIVTNPVQWQRAIGLIIFLSGLFYPHFLGNDLFAYLYGAPVALVPCPTLLTLTGFAMFFNVKQSTSWMLTLFVIDVFYGLFGALRLEVYLDILLIIASPGLIIQLIQTATPTKISTKKTTRLVHHE